VHIYRLPSVTHSIVFPICIANDNHTFTQVIQNDATLVGFLLSKGAIASTQYSGNFAMRVHVWNVLYSAVSMSLRVLKKNTSIPIHVCVCTCKRGEVRLS
jgi:hypothetical protein